jgi:nitrate reductase molybdenum cofactor assembly chaperone NarJ/NarW
VDIIKVISRLMDYPNAELQAQVPGIETVIKDAREISPDMRQQLIHLLHEIYDGDLLDAQEAYTGMFDRGRSLSLLLFEHVHGESRDRGQAMVDLLDVYEEHGFSINARELPDHIPLHLEFLAHLPDLEIREGLSDVSHILGILNARLQERESAYATLFDALLMISGVQVDLSELREKVAGEKRDDTMEELDKIWEEEAVTFGAGDALGSGCSSSAPVPPKKSANDAVAVRWAN